MSRCSTSHFTTSGAGPGECGPSSCRFTYSRGGRLCQSVRSNTQDRGGMQPCCVSQDSTKGMVRVKSGFVADRAEQSITQAGATKFDGGMVSTALSGSSFPVTQWIGASKWVPVCSPIEKLFQYQAGPRSS